MAGIEVLDRSQQGPKLLHVRRQEPEPPNHGLF